jgi:tetratricopeptide (TPR) repeat protein
MAQICMSLKQYEEALSNIKQAVALDEKNKWYQALYADILQKNKMYNEAADVYSSLVKNNPEAVEYYYEWAMALYVANKLPEAIKVYEKLENKTGINPEMIIQKEKLYIKLGKIDKAAFELQKLISAFPKEVQYYGMLAELYLANNMNDKALEIFNKIKEIDPDNGIVHLSLADYYRTIGEKEKSFLELKEVFGNKNIDVDTKLKILSSYFLLIEQYPELKEQTLALNEILIKNNPNEAGAHVFYGEFLYQDKKLQEAQSEYKKAISIDGKNFAVWQQLLKVEFDLQQHDSVITHSEQAVDLFPNQPVFYYFNGIALLQLKKYKEAISKLQSGVKIVVDNTLFEADFYANIGDAYYKLKSIKESDKAFNKAISLDPKNANTLNNYSYYLSLRGDSLDKAESLSRKSNELEPNNSYYQDTYGWILYKQAKFQEAKDWIEKAMKNRNGESAVILEHYGDILFKLGDSGKAYEYWQKAKSIGDGSELLDKKLAEKKLYE